MDTFLWGVVPYLVFLLLVGGLVWRYKYDQFGWTTRSSQMYEAKILKIASPLFHYSLFAVTIGHIVGLLIPKTFTDWIGLKQEWYHAGAYWGGGLAGLALVVALALLIWRRRSNGSVFRATTTNDKLMYLVLALVIGMGLAATFTGDVTPSGEHHNYRETVSIWFRSLFTFQPDIRAMAAATWQFKLHILLAMFLIAIIPFTRLIHSFTVPMHYLFRPYVVYRTRDKLPGGRLPAGPRRGWEAVGTPDNKERNRR